MKEQSNDPKGTSFLNILSFLKHRFLRRNKDHLRQKINNIKKSYSKLSVRERYLLSNTIDFNNKIAENILIHRDNICAVEIHSDLGNLYKLIKETYNTRIIVYEGAIDQIKGYIHIKDLLINLIDNKHNLAIKDIMRKPIISTHAAKLTNLLIEMQSRSTHIAVILDEYGCTEGIVTFEDIIEELVGEIEDEHDEKDDDNDDEFYFLNNNSIMVNGRAKIEVLENAIDVILKQKEDNCDTISGLVISRAGKVPKKGETINIDGSISAKIIDATPKTIRKVNIMISIPSQTSLR